MPRTQARAIDDEQAPNLTALVRAEGCILKSSKIIQLPRKATGAYYTPDEIAVSLTRWVIRSADDRMLDPACGDGRFIAHHENSVGVEKDLFAAGHAAQRATSATIHHADFFEWAAHTNERFDCAVGNPPFIRYQRFKGQVREQALRLCSGAGVAFSGLTSSWAPFLVATATLLRPGGRIAFVVPAEIGHAPYAAPLIEYLVQKFATVHVVAVRAKLFPTLSEDCWLLYADGFGGQSNAIRFTALSRFDPTSSPPNPDVCVSLTEWRRIWKRRLRPLLMPSLARDVYCETAARSDTQRLGDLASVGIGYVSGGNKFFHLRPSQAASLGLPSLFLRPTVRNGRLFAGRRLTSAIIEQWKRADAPMLLLHIPKGVGELPYSITRYLESSEASNVRLGYKCRSRRPWYSVPDVHIPDFFLTYLSGRAVKLVYNEARVTCTNALHYVRLKVPDMESKLSEAWRKPFTELSCEIEGHPLGGGVLKLEPREATAVLFPSPEVCSTLNNRDICHAIEVMRSWRHY